MSYYVGLSTCPKHSSGNVGDQLITDSMVKMLKEIEENINLRIFFREVDFTSRINILNEAKAIFLFGFPIKDKIIPNTYRLAEDLDMIDTPIIPFSGVYKFFPGEEEILKRKSLNLNKKSKTFLDNIFEYLPDQKIPARTKWVKKFLEQNGYESVLIGDPAWYDPDYIYQDFHKPENLDQIVLTPPHYELYLNQCKNLIKKITQNFRRSQKIISFQSCLKETDRNIRKVAKENGWAIKYTSHDTENIEFYKETDLHIGYRKHGHLAHIRWRRPSIVFAEDSRAQGLNETFGTGGFPAFESRLSPKKIIYLQNKFNKSVFLRGIEKLAENTFLNKIYPFPTGKKKFARSNSKIIDNCFEFIEEQKNDNWQAYDEIGKMIDDNYNNKMKPYIESVLDLV